MTHRPLSDDTLGDKVVRFVIGAFLGAATCFLWHGWTGHALAWGLWARGGGVLAVVFGNRLIEAVLEGRWWSPLIRKAAR